MSELYQFEYQLTNGYITIKKKRIPNNYIHKSILKPISRKITTTHSFFSFFNISVLGAGCSLK